MKKSATTNERVGRAAVDERADLGCALVDRAKVETNGHANKSAVAALDGVVRVRQLRRVGAKLELSLVWLILSGLSTRLAAVFESVAAFVVVLTRYMSMIGSVRHREVALAPKRVCGLSDWTR